METPESPAEGTSSDPRPENAGGEAPNEPTETPSEVAPREGESPEAKPEEATEPEEEATVRRGVFQLVSETKAEELPAEDVAGAEGNAPTAEDSAEEDSGDADEYIPLAEVKEEIREILARERAGERMQAALAPISEKMAEFRDKWVVADAMRAEGDEKVEEVPRPDVAAMAKEAGLEFEETPMVDFNAAAKLPIGLATVNAMQPLLRLIFGENYPRFRHGIAEDLEGNQYLFWIVGEEEERIPEFTDEGVRERVLDTWRMIQARKPAREEAARLTEQAEKAGKSLKDEFGGKPGYEVLEPQPFSWLTRGPIPSMTSQQPPRISRVEGVEIPGRDFMKAVFALNPGEFGVAMNNPETVVYAVEMVELQPSARALWELFRLDDFGKYADAALGDQRERISAWRTSLEQEAGLKWERKPHPYRPSR